MKIGDNGIWKVGRGTATFFAYRRSYRHHRVYVGPYVLWVRALTKRYE